MQLSDTELRDLFTAVVQTSGHPDPIGYMARAVILSGGDPDYVGEDTVGFMPVRPADAFEQVGSSDVATLQGNVISTIAMEVQAFQSLEGDLDALMQKASYDRWSDVREALPEARQLLAGILHPRRATVEDVISLLQTSDTPLSKKREAFFKDMVQGK